MIEGFSRGGIKVLLQEAQKAALNSTCEKLQVGAVAIQEHNTYVDAFNTPSDGSLHKCVLEKSCSDVIHAEVYAVLKLMKLVNVFRWNYFLFTTHEPCIECSHFLIQTGCQGVIYMNDYKKNSGFQLFRDRKKMFAPAYSLDINLTEI